ncbi:phosphatase PAP2 family protein [Deinococcus rubellus]|uniref:Phosphatase PAP2 family protein n=1 Tax=Deinococcus rubellus TaxID=1889240 RepID=A0ABY5YHA0_9DEIO|nr:phosphatase PAP2 family protein [Deinococcus rubellus]UWX63546.1 phosphatase PAP2 family protein [Deinococcus rubellus]
MPTLLTHARAARPAQLVRLFLGILLPLLIVGVIAEDILEKARFAFETPLLLWIHSFASPALDQLALAFTTLGGVSVIAPLSALILAFLWWKSRPQAFFWAFSVAGAAVLDFIMKLIFNRSRPELWPRLVHESDASFPSGHSMYSMAFVVALILMTWRTPYRPLVLVLGVLFTLAVGLSRLYLGVHYPTDVLAGWLSGLAWVLGVYSIVARRRA